MPVFPIMFLKLLVTTNLEYDETFPDSFWERFWLNHLDKIEFEEVAIFLSQITFNFLQKYIFSRDDFKEPYLFISV